MQLCSIQAALLLLAELESLIKADVGGAFKPDIVDALATVQRYDRAA